MKKLSFYTGVQFALLMFLVNVLMAVGSYVFACFLTASPDCNVTRGLEWIYRHPVFPKMIPAMTILGFVFGTLCNLVPESPMTLLLRQMPWAIIALLIAAFLLWGLPDIGFLFEQCRAARP
ncbi:MAG: hypothetical protein VX640_11335 [Pseudomonadota bacterium]|nr:hypothetical protein [Pseudomonadota bacterium]